MDNSSDSEIVCILKPGLPGPRFPRSARARARAGAGNSPVLEPRVNGGIYGLHWSRAIGVLDSLHRPGLRWSRYTT
jgi:hypothetical protein